MPVADLRALLDFMADAGAWIAVADVCIDANRITNQDEPPTINPYPNTKP